MVLARLVNGRSQRRKEIRNKARRKQNIGIEPATRLQPSRVFFLLRKRTLTTDGN